MNLRGELQFSRFTEFMDRESKGERFGIRDFANRSVLGHHLDLGFIIIHLGNIHIYMTIVNIEEVGYSPIHDILLPSSSRNILLYYFYFPFFPTRYPCEGTCYTS